MIVAFTGIREADPQMIEEIDQVVLDAIGSGATELRFGGALGADTMALVAACDSDVAKVVYVPFALADQPVEARRVVKECASRVIELELRKGRHAYLERNREMIRGADRVIAFTDGRTAGGTAATMREAHKLAIPVTTIPIASITHNPPIKGLELSAPLWALQEYKRDRPMTEAVRANKRGEATGDEIDLFTAKLIALVRRTPELRNAHSICAMPRRIPDAPSDMQPIAAAIADAFGLEMRTLKRIEEPTGGKVIARRVRFPADEHARTMRYDGVAGERVILLDNVVTTGASLEGAIRAISDQGATPFALACLYSTAFGATPTTRKRR